MTPRAVTTHRQTHPVVGRAWWGLEEGQTKRDMEARNRGKLTVPLSYMSTMLHDKTMPFASPVNDNDRKGNGLQYHLSAVLAHDVDDQMGLC